MCVLAQASLAAACHEFEEMWTVVCGLECENICERSGKIGMNLLKLILIPIAGAIAYLTLEYLLSSPLGDSTVVTIALKVTCLIIGFAVVLLMLKVVKFGRETDAQHSFSKQKKRDLM